MHRWTTTLWIAIALSATLVFSAEASPPSGRPPSGPLQRTKPKAFEMTFEVTLSTVIARDAQYQTVFELRDTPIVMPVIFQSTYSRVLPDSLKGQLWYGSVEDKTIAQRSRIDDNFPFNTHLAVMPIPSFRGQTLRWRLTYTAQVWSSKLNDAAAERIPWPREWPKEVQDGLQPQMFIESNHAIFKQALEDAAGDKLRLVPPFLAAKDLIRYCINMIQVSGDGVDKRELGLIHGLEIQGAAATATSGRGSPHDLVCICVALLRAAGIPARPVIGIQEKVRGGTEFVSWAEFFLTGAGWIPFDPMELRGKGIRNRDVHEPWKELGTMNHLNRRVPLAYHWMPPATVQTPQNPAVWGWDPRPAGAPSCDQFIKLMLVSRGSVANEDIPR